MSNGFTIAVVDDEKIVLSRLRQVLEKMGFLVLTYSDPLGALEHMKRHIPHIVIADVKMPGMDGIELLQRIKAFNHLTEVIVISGFANLDTAIEVTRKGAFYYLSKPFDLDQLRLIVNKALEKVRLSMENVRLRDQINERRQYQHIVFESDSMRQILATTEKIAEIDCSVIIQGESGTGKEIIARTLHQNSLRREKPFVSFNCASLAEELASNELFGHEKDAFTGATSEKKGLIEAANQGTLFLDEIADMSLNIQVKLLRVLQEHVLIRVGGTREVQVDIRVIAATNKDIKAMVDDGTFRDDLYYRLNVVFIDMPPLRQRKVDIPLLVNHFIKKYSQIFNKNVVRASETFHQILIEYSFPGNVRELENIVERAIALSETPELTVKDLPPDLTYLNTTSLSQDQIVSLRQHEEDYIKKIYEYTGKNTGETADLLKISRTTLWRKLKAFGLSPDE